MKNTTSIAIIFILFLIIGCKEKPSSTTPSETKTEDTTSYESITLKEMERLFNECDAVDYVFDDLPFSINMSEKGPIQQSISLISSNPCTYDLKKAKHFARKHLAIKGEIIWIVDVYFSNECQCYAFMKDGKLVYANKITSKGVNFYNNLIQQAKNAVKNQ